MFRRILLFLLILFLPCSIAFGEPVSDYPDLTSYTIDELLGLREKINAELIAHGYNPYFDIERGAKGEAVSDIQEKLQELGHYLGVISGKFDTETQKAFKRFEKENNLKNDGIASREDQVVLFGNEVIVRATETPMPEVTADPMTEVYAEYGSFDYTDSMRFPEKHLGEKVLLKGRVLQVLGNRSEGFQIRFATAGSDDIVYVFINRDPGYNIIENDLLTIYATMYNTITYESTWRPKITIPAAIADYIVLR